MRARSQGDVLLGEAVSGTPQQRFNDMVSIASVIANRAALLGVSPETVVANPREFNAYNKALPAGVEKYRSLADQALGYVSKYGPVHAATFYATPAASKSLPRGLSMVGATTGHQYFTDPKGRAIGTAIGYRRPSMEAQQQISALSNVNVPTPTARPMTAVQAAPVTAVQRQSLAPVGTTTMDAATKAQLTQGLLSQAAQMQAQQANMANVKDKLRADLQKQAADYPNNVNALDGYPNAPKEARFANWGIAPTAAPTPGYTDTQVSVAPAQAYQATPAATPAARAISGAAPVGGLLSAGPSYDAATAKAAAAANTAHTMKGLLGTFGAAAVGGLLGGPIGGLLGAYLGKTAVNKMDNYPSKPSAAKAGDLGSEHEAAVNSPGNQAAVSRSPQAQAAKSSGRAGLF